MRRILFSIGFLLITFFYSSFSFSKGTRLYMFPAHKVVIKKPVYGDILVIGQDVEVLNVIEGSVSVIGGSIKIKGEVSKNCVSIGGNVELLNGKVGGEIVTIGELFGKNRLYWFFLNSLFWIITIGFGLYFYGDRLKENAFEFADDFMRLFFFGFYSLIIFVLLGLISFALIQIGVGIVLFFVISLLFSIIYLFSVLTIFYFFGNSVSGFLKLNVSDAVKMLLGLSIYQALKFVPLFGFLAFTVILSASFGATIYSKFGTFKPWFGMPRFWGE